MCSGVDLRNFFDAIRLSAGRYSQLTQPTDALLTPRPRITTKRSAWRSARYSSDVTLSLMSPGNSYVFETEAPLVFNQSFDPHFTLALHTKDLNIGHEISRRDHDAITDAITSAVL
jgi:hypothetical protein